MSLTDEDLAYMREVQAEHRPTPATLVTRNEVPDGMGGTTHQEGDPTPVMIRVARLEEVPDVLADRYGLGVQTLTMDLTPTTAGDSVRVNATEAYEVVSDGAVTTWTTAQQVYAVRTAWPQGET